MVRCSIKRAMKTLSFCIIAIVIVKLCSLDSTRTKDEQPAKKLKPSSILILSSFRSEAIQRIRLFLDELRLSYVEYRADHYDFHQNSTDDRPAVVLVDRVPDADLRTWIDRWQIRLLVILNDRCAECTSMTYSQMLFENVKYPSVDFDRETLTPVTHTASSPFRIDRSNDVIKILRFKDVLPYFYHQSRESDNRCAALPTQTSTIVYATNRLTSDTMSLMFVSADRHIYISECLFHHWFIWPLMMDTLRYLTSNAYDYHGLQRHIQVDIDDIFLGGKSNDYLTSNDVLALLRSQSFIQQHVNQFRYRLGFSGYFYSNANAAEAKEGNRLLIREKDRFVWFHHTWKHEKLTNTTDKVALIGSTRMNMAFAEKHALPLDSNYAVAPHHTGIYPINPTIYDVWREVMDINVTSTENYPYHYMLPSNRRGFVYRGLAVLPRQSSALYTTTRRYTAYLNDSNRLERYLMGGRLFRTILTNPISVFMSHNVNYGSDRLGNYVFAKLVYLISHWTTIRWADDTSTSELARKYFHDYYPNERMPVFTNPCDDRVLINLWNGNRSLCNVFPQLIIVGPQKTGSTALHAMLSQHPSLSPSKRSPSTFEEVQFFSNDTIYSNGINWYLDRFPVDGDSMRFEKSATYFDSSLAIKRIRALLPNVRLIIILIEPGQRAHSRYQHEMARVPQTIDFDDLLASHHARNSSYFRLRQRCLQPGHYAEHLARWLKVFPAQQIYILDGEAFRGDPRAILDDIQVRFLGLKTPLNSSELVRFNKKKGFFCPITAERRFRCLGNSKGRLYGNMSSTARQYLSRYYRSHNQKLWKLLTNYNYSLPQWLSDN